ncbi:MBL fold metallo-hydrolase [Thermodesulfatator autotrophicus]|uniref:Hydroxyacylglutathione hydrolase n=1 Tax=Thermodesulfatator autotrophicus TaxID=1795632 RepID=A0A177E4Z6_9BACT|nr:MBL fold metallo-hydrolase [Thermodesulfatator autotrophicus]OAG26858.1 hydroxyacylglutathione hydrolase [Thermodesulfatator autotrophicus]
MKIDVLTVGPLAVRCYLLICEETREAAIVDPGGDEGRILQKIKELELNPKYILATHGHGDHVSGAWWLRKKLNIPVAMHEADDEFFRHPMAAQVFAAWGFEPNEPADILLKDGSIIQVGTTISLQTIHTPGHSPGSVCFYDGQEYLFTGDTLFVGAVGRTDLPGGDFEELIRSLREKILPLPDETIICPGHDYGEKPFSTLGEEKNTNPYIVEFVLGK